MTRRLAVREDRGVLRITLRRPLLNILNLTMLAELETALRRRGRDPALRAVVFDAEGKAFSAGTDVADHLPPRHKEMLRRFHAVFRTLERLALPTVAVVEGPALGGGCELAGSCDFVLATPKAAFALPEIRLGCFPPAAIAFFPKRIGLRATAELALTGKTISAREAHEIGLVTKVVPTSKIRRETESLLDALRALSPDALRAAKRALLASAGRPALDALASAERIYLKNLAHSPDMKEGLDAFLEKRPPRWKT